MTVLAGLRGRHVDDLAGTTLDHDVTAIDGNRLVTGTLTCPLTHADPHAHAQGNTFSKKKKIARR